MNTLFKISFTLRTLARYLADYKSRVRVAKKKPLHIVFATVDHYEPGSGQADPKTEIERVDTLLKRYPELVKEHADHAGNLPKRTWFFPPHYHRFYALKKLVSLCEAGYGEIELHLHHGTVRPDTSENLEKTLRQCVEEYSMFGIFGEEKGQKKYAFIHGDWALDNSRHGKYCGVNNEIEILEKTGCYADFTFPSLNESNPAQINSIYYVRDNPHKPKSHNTGVRVAKNRKRGPGLMLVQGPVYPFWKKSTPLGLRIFGDAIDGDPQVTPRRIDAWIRTGIHIVGVPNVVFVKTHTHGSVYAQAALGEEMDFIFAYLESAYNDGTNAILHYATAREMVNIISALEDGKNPNYLEDYRNYRISAPRYDSSADIERASDKLKTLVCKTYCCDQNHFS
ncbi:MAG: hypothetical protein GXO76_10920 [Calditrichaeota bacterium]|nr:hypothetical protein [Calditrichota bacterium]